MVHKILTSAGDIEIGPILNSSFLDVLGQYENSKKIILVDENTHDYCLEYLLTAFSGLEDAEVMLLPCGEENKVMEVCFQVWEAWSEYQIGRNDLVINLGGGVVTDMGGFIASIYKRGLNFIQIPTSLLAMVDASIGGKTGIDLGKFKNQLGVFSQPLKVYIDSGFLSTLPQEEFKNGYAEMLKHGLIANRVHWEALKKINFEDKARISELIIESLIIKNEIVEQDPFEQNDRKRLNFGHTFGHAFEGLFIGEMEYLPHGHAVALGMLAESYISWNRNLLSESDFSEISNVILNVYEIPFFALEWSESIFLIMKNDKKNFNQEVQSVLIRGIGEAVIDQIIDKSDVDSVLQYFSSLRN